jgi:hypothetical protein
VSLGFNPITTARGLYDCEQTGDVSEKKNNTISTAKIER